MAEKEPARSDGWRCAVRFVLWPAQSLRCSLYVIDLGSRLSADSEWADRVMLDLDPELQDDIAVLNGLNPLGSLANLQRERGLTDLAVPDFLTWVSDLPENEPALDLSVSAHVPALDPDGPWYGVLDPENNDEARLHRPELIDRVRRLYSSPGDLRDFVVRVGRVFWDRYLAAEYRRQEPILHEAIQRGSWTEEPRTHRQLILELIGREPMWAVPSDTVVEDVMAVPVCHLGAFPLSAHYEQPRSTKVYLFEAARMPRSRAETSAVTASTYKALADETRLDIIRLLAKGESFGVELSKAIGLSQPTVSKHLRILASEGILKLRMDGLTKYFSLNPSRLDEIAERVKGLSETGEPA